MKLPVVFVVTFLARTALNGKVSIPKDLDSRIFGGQDAEREQFPFIVLFNWCIDPDFCQPVCGASIITPNRVLTAAHCITELPDMGSFTVRGGILLHTDPDSISQIIAVATTMVHPNYAGGVNPNDIAMLNLAGSFTFNSAVQPILLPAFQTIPTGTATIMGWGSILNTTLPYIPDRLQYIGEKEILTLTLLGAVQSGGSAAGNSLSESFNRGPHFDTSASKNVTALLGKTAYLNCRVKNLANRTVSWVRHRDVHLLTVGHYTYTSDQRFRAIHQPHSEDWTLQIKYPQHRDSGVYECQVSSTPHLSHFIHLTVIEPDTEIVGGPELFIDRGSTINLTCVVRHSPEPPAYIFWNHNDVIISYASSRGGVSVATERGDTSRSVLLIQKARPTDSGNYQCNPSNARPANVTVHVLNGEHPEAMQHGGNQRMASTVNVFALFSIVMLAYC